MDMGVAHPGHQHPVRTVDDRRPRILRNGLCLDGRDLLAVDQDVTREQVIRNTIENLIWIY
jgi:hypothetical protein